jgi:hypothetical protein
MSLWFWLLIVFIIWIIYLELSPKLGRILIRPNAKGGYSISFAGIGNLMLKPFQDIMFWNPKFWDLNIYVWWIITILVYKLL